MKFLTVFKYAIVFLCVVLMACDSQDEDDRNLTGIVMNPTSCSGNPEPVFIIKLTKNDSIMTGTLPKEFQVTNLKIRFKTKKATVPVFCTTDKMYPEQFDVYDVVLIED